MDWFFSKKDEYEVKKSLYYENEDIIYISLKRSITTMYIFQNLL